MGGKGEGEEVGGEEVAETNEHLLFLTSLPSLFDLCRSTYLTAKDLEREREEKKEVEEDEEEEEEKQQKQEQKKETKTETEIERLYQKCKEEKIDISRSR